MLPIPLFEAVLACAIVAVASCVQGSIGFGLAVLAAPLLVLIEPEFIPAPLILNGMILVVLLAYRERKTVDRNGVKWMAIGCVPGSAIAAVVLTVVSASGFRIMFSILVMVAVVLSAIGYSIRLTRINILTAGVLSGFMGTTSSIGGPPVALIYQNLPGDRFRGTLSTYFCVAGTFAIIALILAGRCGKDELLLALVVLPGLLIGLAFSRLTAGMLDRRSMRPAVLILSGVSAIAVLVRTIL
ncbi:MAG: sulfite exporter TauE/SafE family protein [Chloroflexi bacterium]|nr:sulfite exporter TauE/SafE family protein [Chloroflexota bacterium]